MPSPVSRRQFLAGSSRSLAAGSTVIGAMPYFFSGAKTLAATFQSKNDRPHLGLIGCGGKGKDNATHATRFSDLVAVCDVDAEHASEAHAKQAGGKATIYEDYRKLLDRGDIDVVMIATPDHWHTQIAVDALRAGKDVYCEKPLTLTIDEGKILCQVVKETGGVLQVGTQQRSEHGNRFLAAVALAHAGRLGTVRKVECGVGGGERGGPFKSVTPPKHLNWDKWLGQAPQVPYMKERCHYDFRWWYEYSGGKMTDWGAHNVDIATWAIQADRTGPLSIEGTGKHQNIPNGYNTAIEFNVRCKYRSGAEIIIRHDIGYGIRIHGDKGDIYVSRGELKGKPVEELQDNPLPEDAIIKLCRGMTPGNHYGNFLECTRTRDLPISDVYTHHRALTTCHLANICLRIGRPLKWNPQTEQIEGDSVANSWLKREPRTGYEIAG